MHEHYQLAVTLPLRLTVVIVRDLGGRGNEKVSILQNTNFYASHSGTRTYVGITGGQTPSVISYQVTGKVLPRDEKSCIRPSVELRAMSFGQILCFCDLLRAQDSQLGTTTSLHFSFSGTPAHRDRSARNCSPSRYAWSRAKPRPRRRDRPASSGLREFRPRKTVLPSART